MDNERRIEYDLNGDTIETDEYLSNMITLVRDSIRVSILLLKNQGYL